MENIRLPDGFESKKYNEKARLILTEEIEVDKLAKALVHYAFRNGPVEDIHASPDSRLTDADMMVLNKYMVNRLAGVLTLLLSGDWLYLELLYGLYSKGGSDWDAAEPDIDAKAVEAVMAMHSQGRPSPSK
jgi:hypothetical protein